MRAYSVIRRHLGMSWADELVAGATGGNRTVWLVLIVEPLLRYRAS